MQKSVTAGSGEPVKTLKGDFKSETEALQKATSSLALANKGLIKGRLSIYGQKIEAGAKQIGRATGRERV